jgi:hypothetical protein
MPRLQLSKIVKENNEEPSRFEDEVAQVWRVYIREQHRGLVVIVFG